MPGACRWCLLHPTYFLALTDAYALDPRKVMTRRSKLVEEHAKGVDDITKEAINLPDTTIRSA